MTLELATRTRDLLLLGALVLSPVLFNIPADAAPQAAILAGGKAPSVPPGDPDRVCASCHAAIYGSYERTSMARSSGPAREALLPGATHHELSDIDYRIFRRADGSPAMSFSRPASSPRGKLQGEHDLAFFIGSGQRGRTFLYENEHLWFELPINFYTRRNAWAMAPAFENVTAMPPPLPVDPGCLHCHATDVQPSLPGARNRFAYAPFRQGGIGCSACHGDPAQHLAQGGHGPILNPARLDPARRDSTCLQCHLEGDAVVFRPGHALSQFRPGDALADYAVYFVRADRKGNRARATSQYEALLRSGCKRAAGDTLTCTTCHDPHSTPAAAERVSWFRGKCLACHTSPALATSHHPEQQDCAFCHMPTRPTSDISHEQVTDHDIQAHPAQGLRLAAVLHRAQAPELVPVSGFLSDDRALGLAYALLAGNEPGNEPPAEAKPGKPTNAMRALDLLTRAAAQGANDLELNLRLGFLQQRAGEPAKARQAYRAVLEENPYEPSALADLAVLDATENRLPEAVHLLERLLAADPSQTAAGLNLANIECALGQREKASATAHLLEAESPDNPQLRQFLQSLGHSSKTCRFLAR